MKSQLEAIKNLLEQKKMITWQEAYKECGCTRLSARIWDLRRQGMKIKSTMIPVKTRRGKTMVSVYRVVEPWESDT